MASFRKRGDKWEAFVAKQGVRKSASFETKAAAVAWANHTENEITAGKLGNTPDKTLAQLLDRYRDEISVNKRGVREEGIRIDRLKKEEIASVKIANLSAQTFATWRDSRLKTVSAATVRREWNLLSHALTVSINEWGWLKVNPMKTVKRPSPPPARDRLFTEDEIERLLFALGYVKGDAPVTMTARVGAALLFAIETGMRAGEICALKWEDVNMEVRTVRVRAEEAGSGKTAAARRDVPLSLEAVKILQKLDETKDGASVFRISSTQSLDALFRKAKSKALVEGVHFHDSRATAITRLAKRLDILSLAKMIGHRDLKMLQVYFRESAADMVKMLD